MIDIENGEKICAYLPVKEFDPDKYILMATAKGLIKKTSLDAFSRPRKGGIIAVNIREDDSLIAVKLSSGDNNVIYVTKNGKSINFHENDVRAMGRTATGVRAINLKGDDEAISMVVTEEGSQLLTISENGFGKRTPVSDYRRQTRGGSGIIAMNLTDKTGKLIAAKALSEQEDIMIITENGVVIRQSSSSISVIGRNTQGVKLIRLDEKDSISDVALVAVTNEEDDGSEEAEE